MNKKLKVQVWICCKLPRESEYKFLILFTRPGRGEFWQPITGGVEEDERVEVAAQREASEETGLQFTREAVNLEFQFDFVSRGEGVTEFAYFFDISDPSVTCLPSIQLDPHEHTAYRWVDAQDAHSSLVYASNQTVLQLVLKKLHANSES